MAAAPAGAVVKIYVDTRVPMAVDDVITTPTGRAYLVLGVRVQTKGKRVGRQHLQVLVLEPDNIPPDARRFMLHWYKRPRRQG